MRTRLALPLALVALAFAAAPSAAQSPVVQRVIAPPNAVTFGYANPEVVIREGDSLRLLNLDMVFHTVTALDFDGNSVPLFDTDAPGFNRDAAIDRVEGLPAGAYRFQCFFHGTLQGRLTVLPASAGT